MEFGAALALIGGVVVVVGGAVIIKKIIDTKNTTSKPEKEETPLAPEAKMAAPQPVEEKAPAMAKPIARSVMRQNAKIFFDICEPIYQVSQKMYPPEDAVNVFEEWEQRIAGLPDSEKLVEKWGLICQGFNNANQEAIASIAYRWLNLLASYGISRDSKNEIQIYEKVDTMYDRDNGQPLVDGEYMLVKQAAWFLDGDIAFKGVLADKGDVVVE